ncbi:MAG: DUF3793 family protein [Aristaeellaceae bacterium]
MPDEMVIRHCAPTLASIKTGSLFSCPCESDGEVLRSVRGLNRRLGSKGLRVMPLRRRDGRCLVYVYRPRRLARDLKDEQARRILAALGYPDGNPGGCLRRLRERLRTSEEFPHEIGLFLGYPPEDVAGFIGKRAEAKCVGCWKVYGDEERARRLFTQYKHCTSVYLRQYAQGKGIERLTVAV